MDKAEVFKTLGISESKDENILKTAYYEKLVAVNPEDDPEGFKKLRQAYEQALELSKVQQDEVQEQEDDSALGRWIKKVEQTYLSMPNRINVECWKALLKEEVCVSLEDSNKARERLLSFMLNHYRFPTQVWLLFGKEFQFARDQQELYELFPEGFIHYVVSSSEQGDWFNYDVFEGEECADYDGFMYEYHEIRNRINDGETEDIDRALDKLSTFSIYHPYVEVERVRLFIRQKNIEGLEALVNKFKDRYTDDDYISYYMALAKWELGDYQAVFDDCNQILEHTPDHYNAKRKIAQYYLKTGEYDQAKQSCEELLDVYPSDETVMDILRNSNEYIIKQLEEKYANDNEDISALIEMGWCLYQNERYEEVIELLKDIEPKDKEDIYDYENLLGRAYCSAEKYKLALYYLEKWKKNIEKLTEDTEKNKRRKTRWGYAVLLIAHCYKELANEEDKKSEYLGRALACIKQAMTSKYEINRLDFLRQKADIYLQLHQYEKCIDVCQQMLELDDQYVIAYIYRQEAYYELRYAQEVIDDYYRIIDIIPHYAKAYVFAVKVFYDYDQLSDVTSVLDRANEANVKSQQLQLFSIKLQRRNADTPEQTQQVIALCEALKSEAERDDTDIEDISEIFAQQALCYMDLKDYAKAHQEIDAAIKINTSNAWYHKVKCDILGFQENYEQAIERLESLLEQYPNYEAVYYDLGYYYEKIKNYDEAMDNYKKLLEMNPEHIGANSRLRWFYQKMYNKTFEDHYFELAEKYASFVIDLRQDAQSYIDRGILYVDKYALDLAIKDFNKAIELDPDSIYAYDWLGDIYKIDEQYDKALDMYKKSVENTGDQQEYHPHLNLGECYEAMGEYEQAIEKYLFVLNMYPEDIRCHENLARTLKKAKRYQQAIEYYDKILKLPDVDTETGVEAMTGIAVCQEFLEDYKAAKATYENALKEFPMESKAYIDLASYYLRVEEDYINAIHYNERGMKELDKSGKEFFAYADVCEELMSLYDMLGHKNQVKKYFELFKQCLTSNFENEEKYLKNVKYRKARLYGLAVKNIYSNQLRSAEAILERMLTEKNCVGCTYGKCVEAYVIKAMLCERQGKYKEALSYYEIVVQERYQVETYRAKMEELNEKL